MTKYRAGVLNGLSSEDNYDIALSGVKDQREGIMQLAAEAKQREKDHMVLSQQMSEYLGQFQNLEFDDIDIGKVREMEKMERKKIADSIRKNGGDVKKFLKSGGYEKLQQYASNIKNSDAYKNGMKSAYNYKLLLENVIKKPENVAHKVNVNVNGEERFVHPYEAVQLKQQGLIDVLPYAGHFKKPELERMTQFFKSHHAPDTIYGRQVTPNELQGYMNSLGLPEWYSQDFVARETANFNPQLAPWEGNKDYLFHWGQNEAAMNRIASAAQQSQKEKPEPYFPITNDVIPTDQAYNPKGIELLAENPSYAGNGTRSRRLTNVPAGQAFTDGTINTVFGDARVLQGSVTNPRTNAALTGHNEGEVFSETAFVRLANGQMEAVKFDANSFGGLNIFGNQAETIDNVAGQNHKMYMTSKGVAPKLVQWSTDVVDLVGNGLNTDAEGYVGMGKAVLSVDPDMFTKDGWARYFPGQPQKTAASKQGIVMEVYIPYEQGFSKRARAVNRPEGGGQSTVKSSEEAVLGSFE